MCFTLVSSVGYEFKSNPLKFELQFWKDNWVSTLGQYWLSWNSVLDSILGELLKWISQINMLQTLVSFESMKFVLCNGDVCLMVSR